MNQMEAAAKAARREYYREYRKKNPEKVREINRRYWEKRARIAAEKQERAEEAVEA